jgi:hypothetical protein
MNIEWLWVVMGGYGWLWVVMGGYGWLWVAMNLEDKVLIGF